MINKREKNTRDPRDRGRKDVVKDEFDSKLLDLARVTKVTGGGKTMRFRAVIVVGNKTGKVGIGAAKGLDVSQAIDKATRVAKKNIERFRFPREPYLTRLKLNSALQESY